MMFWSTHFFLSLYDLFETTVLTFLFANYLQYKIQASGLKYQQNTLQGLTKLWGELIGKYVVYESGFPRGPYFLEKSLLLIIGP